MDDCLTFTCPQKRPPARPHVADYPPHPALASHLRGALISQEGEELLCGIAFKQPNKGGQGLAFILKCSVTQGIQVF